MYANPSPPQLEGFFDFLKPVERALRKPVNAILQVVPGGKTAVAVANAIKGVGAQAQGATPGDFTPAVAAAGAQQVADRLKDEAAAAQAREAAILGTSARISPTTALLGAGLLFMLLNRRGSRR